MNMNLKEIMQLTKNEMEKMTKKELLDIIIKLNDDFYTHSNERKAILNKRDELDKVLKIKEKYWSTK